LEWLRPVFVSAATAESTCSECRVAFFLPNLEGGFRWVPILALVLSASLVRSDLVWLSGGGELRSMGAGADDGVVGEVGLEKGERLTPVEGDDEDG